MVTELRPTRKCRRVIEIIINGETVRRYLAGERTITEVVCEARMLAYGRDWSVRSRGIMEGEE